MSTMKRSVTALLVSLITVGASLGGVQDAGAQVLERMVESGTLRVALSGNQPPFNTKNRSGDLMGLEVDLANMLGDAFGLRVEFVIKPFPELLPALKASEVDMVMSGMAITPSRSLEAEFVGPYVMSGKSILTNSRVLAEIEQTGDINRAGLKLVALEGSTSQEFAEAFLPEAQLVTTADYDTAVQLVLDDQVDAMVADMPICVLSVIRYPDRGLATLSEPLTLEPIGIGLPPNAMHLKGLLESYLRAFEVTGVVEQLRKKWLEDGSWVAALP